MRMPSWTPAWDRRAERARNPQPSRFEPYDRNADPLLDLDLRDVWEQLTGDEPNASGRVRCPNPDHDDRWPDCSPREHDWRCFGCGAHGSIIDLGALLYGIEPRGRGFHTIRQRLLADLGMGEARAA